MDFQELFSLRQVRKVEQTLGVLTFSVVSLVILQTRRYEQHATNFTILENILTAPVFIFIFFKITFENKSSVEKHPVEDLSQDLGFWSIICVIYHVTLQKLLTYY